jgi:hypothetical protein
MSHRPCPPLACRLSDNKHTNFGRDMSGLLKLVEILPQTKIESLECGPAPECLLSCQRPLTQKQTLLRSLPCQEANTFPFRTHKRTLTHTHTLPYFLCASTRARAWSELAALGVVFGS